MSAAERFDFVVVGAGIAGLRAAMTLAKAGSVLVVTKEKMAESNTAYAQGGIAVAMGGAEDVAEHLDDTVMAGDGLVNREAAQVLVEQGPARVEELLAWGTEFDREQGDLMRTREGAHSRSRILHAHGDATGWEIARSLLRMVTANPRIEVREFVTTIDLLRADTGRVCGVVLEDAQGETRVVEECAVLLASGGAGQVYSDTTNPAVATGDGIAMAWRAGAAISDMEFYQFHPTAFSQVDAPRFLLSEALRGEGAYLRNTAGERFMSRYHKLAELAPRDVVARAITREGMTGEVYLDMRHVQKDLKARFPGISTFLSRYGFELGRDLIPVRPAAHYLMGGVRTDTHGRTSLPGLYAAGECACTGVHGANRLASNSLLEGLVFGALAAEAMVEECGGPQASKAIVPTAVQAGSDAGDVEAWIAHLRALMWEKAGLLRDAERLREAKAELAAMVLPAGNARRSVEARNLHAIAVMIVIAALAREESRGAHFRNDFPQRDDVKFGKHSVLRDGVVDFK
ncbi:L-aspartate oxidase [Terriglobus sp. 2YAB30_2]|uniref:L-aspartate oxidase n=1 Tax=unclassified Terriglobus TaxID=2628988 RepID=UPI003F9D2E40